MKLIYIAGDNRSGSTILDMMLGGHSEITSIGEAHHLRAYATKDTRHYEQTAGDRSHEMRCFCNEPLEACGFWKEVRKALGQPLETLTLKPFFLRTDLKNQPLKYLWKKFLWGILHFFPSLYDKQFIHKVVGGKRIGMDSKLLYQAVATTVNTRYVLDSSKSPHRMYSIAREVPQDMKIILLCRDYKGTVYSKVKRGIPMIKAALQWKWTVQQMERYSQEIPQKNVLKVKYEDICESTEQEMRRISEFLELNYESSMLKRNQEGLHHLGGSPSKYACSDEKVKLDLSYKTHLTHLQRTLLYCLVKNEAKIWHYTK